MYENSRFLKNRFTFCGVNTNFGQQWAPPAYYHLTPIVSKGKHWRASKRGPGCFIFCQPKQTGKQTLELPVIWDALMIMTSP